MPQALSRRWSPNAGRALIRGVSRLAGNAALTQIGSTPASVDLEELKKLRATLTKFEGILEMMKPKATASKRPPNETASRYRNRFFGLAFGG